MAAGIRTRGASLTSKNDTQLASTYLNGSKSIVTIYFNAVSGTPAVINVLQRHYKLYHPFMFNAKC